ncbi:metallophosphoesterase family protein [Staphylococcus massiliensis]|uniref:Metallophosphoesterase n=1 Tax=Staphylococcus massiliensis S46 TaxID=1229783 RepID=K9AYI7_9STAP|nr:DNA repair exonuclease [Staphylococcus massiliensis]EKU46580.1 metallophosphoesterase [Staphylococcus massiliensis S46]MCG3399655.1 DNA repair exonuclease [Staphylococcus massiliensis]MCG3400759.1 DNA repair exonuclease [Staphylococcus massiliensis]MCG3412076.1 DNA repair exonuclease [Staphylococcus massiliensis]PNZ99315.1 DNA repair exonuclease [Staphylococcus massiliensis CCUG 55927]
MVKFIHCADLHLDSPFKSRKYLSPAIFKDVENSTFDSFKRIIDLALKEEVDFLIISGDLFDNENRTLRAEVFLKQQFERLEKEQIFVYIIHGNHDPLSESVSTSWPKNVTVFNSEVETYQSINKNGEVVYLHGFSYQNSESYENKIDQYPASEFNKGIHIGILHGTYSKSQTKDRYTEFRIEDLNRKLYHYWALGHIHERTQLSDLPHIHYPGNIQGRHFKEQGDKGCLLVEGDATELYTRFFPTHSIRFDEAVIEIDSVNKQALYEAIHQFKEHKRKFGRAFYKLKVNVTSDECFDTQDVIQVEDLLMQNEENELNFIVIEQITFDYVNDDSRAIINEFPNELIKDDKVFYDAVQDLYLNPEITRFLDSYKEFDRKTLIDHAESLLKSELRGESK